MPTINKPSRKRPNERRPERLIIVQCLNWNSASGVPAGGWAPLIIVQCLNWNISIHWDSKKEWTYNRTMLELKYINSYRVANSCITYNRTMLELKWRHICRSIRRQQLIIVQCLNWNSCIVFMIVRIVFL